MTAEAKRLLDEALKLSTKERAALARGLIVSLEDEPLEPAEEVEAAWAGEIRERVTRVRAGEPGIPAEQVIHEARSRLHELSEQSEND